MSALNLKGLPEYRLWLIDRLVAAWLRTFVLIFFGFGAAGFLILTLLLNITGVRGLGVYLPLGGLFSGVFIFGAMFELFLRTASTVRPVAKISNIASAFDQPAFRVLADTEPQTCGGLSGALLRSPAFSFFSEKLLLDPALLAPQVAQAGDEACFQAALAAALANAANRQSSAAGVGDLLMGLARTSPVWKQFFDAARLTESDLKNVVAWHDLMAEDQPHSERFWEPASFLKVRPIGLSWASGYTVNLDRFTRDVAFAAGKGHLFHAVVHRAAIERIEGALAANAANNALVVGGVGVGKKAAIRAFARRVYQGQSLGFLNYKRVLELDMEALLSGLSDPGHVRDRLITVLNEAIAAGDVILVIHSFEQFLGNKSIIGTGDVSEVFIPYLQSPRFQLIATTTEKGFEQAIEPNAQLSSLFVKVPLAEPTPDETITILADLACHLELRSSMRVSYSAIREIVSLADQYLLAQKRPLKAVKVLTDIFSSGQAPRQGSVYDNVDIQGYFSRTLGFAVGATDSAEREKLLNLEQELHRLVVGQEAAVKFVADAMRRSRAGVHDRQRPIGSFLFLGPTGVGKTSLAKALAAVYFGDEKAMIRFDMSEYQDQASIVQFIGSAALGRGGRLTEAVKVKPFSLILFDEIEKANEGVLNIFLQILDEGTVRDGLDDDIAFANTIIIATSNAGSEFIREHIEEYDAAALQVKLLDEIQRQRIFRPEFLNRFDAIVPFHPLTEGQIADIARLMLGELAARVKAQHNITVRSGEDVVTYLVKNGFVAEFGARPMRRIIQDKVESLIADALLKGTVTSGQAFTITAHDLESK